MLKIYLSSVVIWMIIIYCAATICGPKIKENGWLESTRHTMGKWTALFVLSVIPLLRLLVLSVIFYMSIYTKEQYEKMQDQFKEDDE